MAAHQVQETLAAVSLEKNISRNLSIEERARMLAEKHLIVRKPGTIEPLLNQLKTQEKLLNEAHRLFTATPSTEPVRSYASEWLLDNFYIVQQALREIREDMPKGYYQRLPKLANPGAQNIARVYVVALETIDACTGPLQLDPLVKFVQAYQERNPLLIGEVWALPTMLRIIIIEQLSYSLSRITNIPLEGENSPLAASLSEDIPDENIVANSILSLRMIANEDWKTFFEQVNLAEQVLRNDPPRVYESMDFETRDSYRKKIEEMALASHCGEVDVAREAIRLAEISSIRDGTSRTAHVGYYLLDKGNPALQKHLNYKPSLPERVRRMALQHPAPIYVSLIGTSTAGILIALMWYSMTIAVPTIQIIVLCLLFLIPASRIATGIINWILTHLLNPRILPKLDFRDGVPAECRTMVVIPTLLTDSDEVKSLLQQLERHYLGNIDSNVWFALLGDFTDAPEKHMPDDDSLIEQMIRGMNDLNARHSHAGRRPFFFFNREREWCASEGVWMCWERKRGNLQQFNHLILKEKSSYTVQIGDLDILPEIKYVITLDADTVLPRDTARRLVSTLAHPLNRPNFDETGRIVSGYSILQPRTEVKPASANQTFFTQIFAGDTGLDLYTRAVSDVYQDFFGEGIYVGKGIYDAAAFDGCTEGRVPTDAVLSHDLIEGLHGRVALVSDVVLLEEYPSTFLMYMHRLHRWVRGDWQLLPWLFKGRLLNADNEVKLADLPFISRWKVVDNLNRSLLAPLLFFLLILGWLWFEGSSLVWTLIFILTPAVPLAAALVVDMTQNTPLRLAATRAIRWLLALVFLPYESLTMLRAITSTVFRLAVTRRHLLQWTSAAHAFRIFGRRGKILMFWQQMFFAPFIAVVIGLVTGFVRPSAFPVSFPILFAWFISPQVAFYLSRPSMKRKQPLSAEQQARLRSLARRTWLFFEQFVGPEDHWLPPDHFQESPRGLVAHRTSVTNIGLMLVSIMTAYDMGYIGPLDLVARLRSAFESMEELERYRGHFLNWYDTRTLEPLLPRYVSTVDSGNLAACLIALKESLRTSMKQGPLLPQRWQGLGDAMAVLDEIVGDLRYVPPQAILTFRKELEQMRRHVEEIRHRDDSWGKPLLDLYEHGRLSLEQHLMAFVEENSQSLDPPSVNNLRTWSERIRRHMFSMHREIETLTPWIPLIDNPPAPFQQAGGPFGETLRKLCQNVQKPDALKQANVLVKEVKSILDELNEQVRVSDYSEEQRQSISEWCSRMEQAMKTASHNSEQLLEDYQDLISLAEKFVRDMQFNFLFDAQREIFYIGYNVDSEQLDNNRYDLLASEARIASIIAIAKGDVPQSHWLHLSRPLTLVHNTRALISWAGTMFEYLMPALLVRQYENSLLDQTSHAAIKRQIDYCRRKKVPWGVSESGYYRFDVNLNYQYRAFGVPGLGFKRGLNEDLVIAPYASLLALSFYPQEVSHNIEHLVRLQMLGAYGFYEAADYTQARLILGQERSIVRSFMSHHQSMILLSLDNYLFNEIMVRRFHADPSIQSVELLLQEQIPFRAPLEELPDEEGARPTAAAPLITATPWQVPAQSPFPQAYCLSNGSYTVIITSAGSGYSSWKEIDVTRWRADTTLDDWGSWIYVQDLDTGESSSVGYQPTATAPHDREVFFYPHKADFRSKMGDIILHMEVAVPPEEDGEIRRLTITNQSSMSRRISITDYAEVVLSPHEVDRRHPAFNKMFIESDFNPELNTLVLRRRPRSSDERPVYLAHTLVLEPGVGAAGMHESDRYRFLGRGGNVRSPFAIGREGSMLTNTTGATLDPIMALSQEIIVEPHSAARVAFISIISERRRQAVAHIRRYQDWPTIDRAFEMARSRSELELRQLKLQVANLQHFQQMLSLLMYPYPALRAEQALLASNEHGQPALWPFSISGDYPILLVRINREEESALMRDLLKAHAYWRNRQLKIDMVLLNMRETGYSQELQNHLLRLLGQTNSDMWLNQRGGIFLLRADQMSESERTLLETASRVILDGERGSLVTQLEKLQKATMYLPAFAPTLPPAAHIPTVPPLDRPKDLQFDNGFGGFSPDGREYVMYLEPGRWTPQPWINVISNPEFGFFVTEAGGGCTWSMNSGENRLTSWSNDPVLDPPGEAIYLRDEETGELWSPAPLPAGDNFPYLVRHGAGYSIFEHHSHGIRQILTVFAAINAPVKLVQLRLENLSQRTRRVTVTYYAEWVLGNHRESMQQYIIPEYDQPAHALLAKNPYNLDFGGRVAFLAASKEPHGLTTDRTEFLGRMGSLREPAGLRRIGLSGTVSAAVDPCAALQIHIDLYPNESAEEFFLLGQAADRNSALDVVNGFRDAARVETALADAKKFWDRVLGTIEVNTPDNALNLLLNRWLLYQNLSCRVWGRSAFYQSSGAYGYRDQLQDVLALLHSAPNIAREHLVRAAVHQFEAGDVLHWWHPISGRGLRTRTSDDLLWLPYVAAEYIAETGDAEILQERIPFLRGDPLKPEEVERYGSYQPAMETASLYEHCLRAIRKGSTSGTHGLPLIGTGDWNDGMNRIGIMGAGESIWLAWFLCSILNAFIPLCKAAGDNESASRYTSQLEQLKKALAAHAWDGEWYLRAFHDDGSLVGSSRSTECRIDSIAQSWAILSQAGEPERMQAAMNSVMKNLVKPDEQLVLLFTPPFDKTSHDPGYIKGYPPGIRENGGQYTHAALWAVWALTMLGDGNRAQALLRLLNPINHSDNFAKAERYQVEPYVIAADVYSVHPFVGRGGWTWYTGSAGWMYRLGIEAILGIRRRGNSLEFNPCIPKEWNEYTITYRFGKAVYNIHIRNPEHLDGGVASVTIDGQPAVDMKLPLKDDAGEHEVIVRIGAPSAA